jgi:hypothetical protein
MNRRGPQSGWLIVIPALVLGVWVLGVMIVGQRGHVKARGWLDGQHGRLHTSQGAPTAGDGASPELPERLDDSRLSVLKRSADTWRRSLEPRRTVIDQVCLVSDFQSFLEVISLWDDQHFFPILIDEPAWTLPFVRSFRPARVVRYTRRALTAAGPPPNGRASPSSREAEWSRAVAAVALACSGRLARDAPRAFGDAPSGPGQAAPGVVLSAPGSPMLAGAVALAAGHFQPLVRVNPFTPSSSDPSRPSKPARFHDVLTQPAAWDFAHQIEGRVSALALAYDQLGDRCDFLTLAGDWPYRYEVREGSAPIRGIFALDDLIGRKLEGGPNLDGLNRSRRRWAYVGRLLGDPAASVARAMAALFLPPRSALMWNTYSGGLPWSRYTMNRSAGLLGQVLPGAGAVVHRAFPVADLTSWHLTVDPVNRYGLVLFNSSGGPDQFSIAGGPGRPGDVPRGVPTAVLMIHSFSAADPLDPQTIAGRWLDQWAFVYFGSVWEPFLPAFRTPRLVADLAAAGIPLAAALRQGELEPFGFPWRLVYLGDPLYRLRAPLTAKPGQTVAKAAPDRPKRYLGGHPSSDRAKSRDDDPSQSPYTGRLTPNEWRKPTPTNDDWPFIEIEPAPASSIQAFPPGDRDSDRKRLNWCLDAAIGELLGPRPKAPPLTPAGAGRTISATNRVFDGQDARPPSTGRATKTISATNQPAGWRTVLSEVRRDRLDSRERPVFDELLIDALAETGGWDELQGRLERIPPDEASARIWEAIEMCAIVRLARLARNRDQSRGFANALGLWDEVMRVSWPDGWKFPAQFTERVSVLVRADRPRRLEPWLDRLRRTGDALAVLPGRRSQAVAISAERARAQAQPGER